MRNQEHADATVVKEVNLFKLAVEKRQRYLSDLPSPAVNMTIVYYKRMAFHILHGKYEKAKHWNTVKSHARPSV